MLVCNSIIIIIILRATTVQHRTAAAFVVCVAMGFTIITYTYVHGNMCINNTTQRYIKPITCHSMSERDVAVVLLEMENHGKPGGEGRREWEGVETTRTTRAQFRSATTVANGNSNCM